MRTQAPIRRLYRSRTDVLVFGVGGGIAEYLNIDLTLVRVVLVLLLVAATGPFAPLVYAILAYIIPQAPTQHGARVYDAP